MSKKIIKERRVCKACGQPGVKVDAWVVWDEDLQKYVIDEIFPDSWCDNCEGQATVETILYEEEEEET